MDQTELMIAVGGGLFAAFLLGWLAGWLALRASGPARPAAPAPEPLTLDAANRLAAAQRDAAVARDELRAARTEIEELRRRAGHEIAELRHEAGAGIAAPRSPGGPKPDRPPDEPPAT